MREYFPITASASEIAPIHTSSSESVTFSNFAEVIFSPTEISSVSLSTSTVPPLSAPKSRITHELSAKERIKAMQIKRNTPLADEVLLIYQISFISGYQ